MGQNQIIPSNHFWDLCWFLVLKCFEKHFRKLMSTNLLLIRGELSARMRNTGLERIESVNLSCGRKDHFSKFCWVLLWRRQCYGGVGRNMGKLDNLQKRRWLERPTLQKLWGSCSKTRAEINELLQPLSDTSRQLLFKTKDHHFPNSREANSCDREVREKTGKTKQKRKLNFSLLSISCFLQQ